MHAPNGPTLPITVAGPRPAAAEGPRLWTEGGYVAQGRLDMTPMNTPTDPGHHQGS